MRAYTQKQQQLLAHWSEALGTEAFQSHRITLDHLSNALEPAAEQFQRDLQQLGLDVKDYLPLPSPPWQAHEELPHSFANEIADNLLIITDIVALPATRPCPSARACRRPVA